MNENNAKSKIQHLSSRWRWINWSSFVLLLGGILLGCTEGQERGCLDVRAVNFQVDSDVACNSCCTYPQFRVNFRHKVTQGDTSLNLVYNAVPFQDDFGHFFRFDQVQYYLSNLAFVFADGRVVSTSDSITVSLAQTAGDSLKITQANSFALVNPANFARKTMGTFQADGGTVTAIRFQIGITGFPAEVTPSAFSSGHPLAAQTDTMYQAATGYLFAKMRFYRDTFPDSPVVSVSLSGAENLRTVTLPVNFILAEGFHQEILLQVDYDKWLSGVRTATDTPAMITSILADNLANSFRVISVTAQQN